jgi:hypothetical protein
MDQQMNIDNHNPGFSSGTNRDMEVTGSEGFKNVLSNTSHGFRLKGSNIPNQALQEAKHGNRN